MYEGEWKEEKYHGKGKLYDCNGALIYEGLFNFGVCYFGDWKQDVGAHGKGIANYDTFKQGIANYDTFK